MNFRKHKIEKLDVNVWVTKGYGMYYSREDLYQQKEVVTKYQIKGPLVNKTVDTLDEARRKIRIAYRNKDGEFKRLRKQIKAKEKQIKKLQKDIDRIDDYIYGY